MKKSIRLVSILMAMLFCFSCLSTGVSAQYYGYDYPAGYDALEHPYISAFQCGSIIIDKIDAVLAEKDMHDSVKVIGIHLIDYDLRSIDLSRQTVHELLESSLWSRAKSLANLGDYERINFTAIESLPARNAVGRTDLEILYGLFQFLYDNKTLIGKLIDGKWDDGVVEYGLKLNDELGDLHARIKEIIYGAMFDEDDKPVCTAESTIDKMVEELIYNKLVKPGALLDDLEGELVASGFMSAPGLANFTLTAKKDANGNITNSVYKLVRCAIRAAIKQYAAPALTDALSKNIDTIAPLLTELLGMQIPGDLAGDDLVTYIVNDILDLQNGVLSKYIEVSETGIRLTDQFEVLMNELIETAQGLMSSLATYDTVDTWSDAEVANLTREQTLAYLVRTLLVGMVDYAVIPLTMPVRDANGYHEEPVNGYAVATYMLINVMADKMPEKDYMQMIENYKNGVGTPSQQLNPGQVGNSSLNQEPAAFTVLADYMYYFLNAKTTMNIPAGLDFDETLQFIINWAIKQWGGLLRTDNLDLHTTPTATNKVVWKNLDILLWENVFNFTWLPDDLGTSLKDAQGNYTGNVTRTLLLDNLLYTLVNLNLADLNNLLTIFNKYQGKIAGYPATGEFDLDVIQFVLTLLKRLLNGMFQSNSALFNNTAVNTFEDIVKKDTIGSTGNTNLRILVENLCQLLATKIVDPVDGATKSYAEKILVAALPLVVSSMAEKPETARNFNVYPMNGETYTISQLADIIESQQPSNELHEDMMTDDNYFFFGGEDFRPLYKFYNYRTALREAKRFLQNYDPEVDTQDELNTIAYRVSYYYNLLSLRDADVTQLLKEINNAIDTFGTGEYEFAEAGLKYNAAQFTKKTWNSYMEALNFAQSVYRDFLLNGSTTVRQSKISAARELLILAEKGLKFFGTSADYSVLNRLIALAQARQSAAQADPTLYVPESLARLISMLQQACAVDTGYDGDDQNIIDEAAIALEDALNRLAFQPQIAKVDGKNTVVDKLNGLIYGLAEKLSDYDSYIQALGNGIIRYKETSNGYGTGTEAYLSLDGQTLQSYTVIIFGDVDGDSRADATDANMVLAFSGDMMSLSVYAELAADINNLNGVDAMDAYYLRQSGMQKFTVDQRGVA